jgi:hypothetical protein
VLRNTKETLHDDNFLGRSYRKFPGMPGGRENSPNAGQLLGTSQHLSVAQNSFGPEATALAA